MVSTCPKSFLEIELLCPLSGQYINHIRKEYHTRTHTRQELDHCSDPSGTESCNMQNSLNKHWLQNNEKDSLFNSSNWILQVQGGDQPPLPTNGNSFVACSMPKVLHAPALLKERTEERKREKFYIYSDVTRTHTHTCSELSLRILLRNASAVQKHPSYTWQEQEGVWCGVKRKFFRRHLEEWNKINRSQEELRNISRKM